MVSALNMTSIPLSSVNAHQTRQVHLYCRPTSLRCLRLGVLRARVVAVLHRWHHRSGGTLLYPVAGVLPPPVPPPDMIRTLPVWTNLISPLPTEISDGRGVPAGA